MKNKRKQQEPKPAAYALEKLLSKTAACNLTENEELDTKQQVERLCRLAKTLVLCNTPINLLPNYMLNLVMYDITNNKVRKYIADYLERKGYVRIQNSVFFGNIPKPVYQEVHTLLHKVNSLYKNGDSIVLLPIATDAMQQIQLIGKNINFTTMVNKPHTIIV